MNVPKPNATEGEHPAVMRLRREAELARSLIATAEPNIKLCLQEIAEQADATADEILVQLARPNS